jgi:hypothetical protein
MIVGHTAALRALLGGLLVTGQRYAPATLTRTPAGMRGVVKNAGS